MLKMILILPVLFLFACTGPGAETGFAPGASAPVVPPATTTTTNHVKYGETVMTSNGWQVSNDNADPVEQKTLPNGWQVEVKYE